MGRLGITYTEVENAAVLLKSQGLNPTVDAVRAALGTGSKSTIVPYLKKWRGSQEANGMGRPIARNKSEEQGSSLLLSPKLLSLLKELYEHLQVGSETEMTLLKKELADLKGEIKKLAEITGTPLKRSTIS